ncbi:uncharacterized protein K489DRAFT_370226 [Dissoconium aciculare CBS 342.82]|uniref:Uncharacterized protein n=1 Tax=Dissoconium aciculare CBS 342.82 TaxID=1314786 RepID=A0A6J3M3U5_9PEZI|nr:uncharacterized protein K489DRAFT_370226 [Dissoconium aciculare CBS 342.82]KAF1822573.1 hypothetical protein K489DRAFT_370226 [Dissoconium aciculare CBS 342.82]
MSTSSTKEDGYPSWEMLSPGTNSSLVNDDTRLDPTLDFLGVQWELSHSTVSEAVRFMINATDERSGSKPFNQDESYAQSSICETPISAVTISIHELTEWQRIWKKGHDDHFYIFKTTGENACGCKPEDAPASPTLTITAPEGKFVTIGQYVQEVFPWLRSLERQIREAIGQFDGPLDPEWNLVPMPLIDRIFIYNDRLGADLEAMEYASKQREKVAVRKLCDGVFERNPSYIGATDRPSMKSYLPLTAPAQMPLSLEFFRLRWTLSSDPDEPAVFVVDDPVNTAEAGNGEEYTPENPIAAASIGERPISAVVVSVDVLDQFYDAWCNLHSEDDPAPDFDSKPRPPNWRRRCIACNEDSPRPGPGPRLFLQAPSRYHFITIGHYVKEVLPWLRKLEPQIRRAIVKGTQTVSTYEALQPEWDVIPFIANCALIQICHNEPKYGRQTLHGMKKRRALQIKQRQQDANA